MVVSVSRQQAVLPRGIHVIDTQSDPGSGKRLQHSGVAAQGGLLCTKWSTTTPEDDRI